MAIYPGEMKIKCTNEGLLSNFELLEILRERTHEPGKTPRYPQPHDPFPTELQCYETLRKAPARFQNTENVSEFMSSVKPIALTSSECLKLINLKPTTDVEIHMLVEGCESRLAEDEVADLLQLVANLL